MISKCRVPKEIWSKGAISFAPSQRSRAQSDKGDCNLGGVPVNTVNYDMEEFLEMSDQKYMTTLRGTSSQVRFAPTNQLIAASCYQMEQRGQQTTQSFDVLRRLALGTFPSPFLVYSISLFASISFSTTFLFPSLSFPFPFSCSFPFLCQGQAEKVLKSASLLSGSLNCISMLFPFLTCPFRSCQCSRFSFSRPFHFFPTPFHALFPLLFLVITFAIVLPLSFMCSKYVVFHDASISWLFPFHFVPFLSISIFIKQWFFSTRLSLLQSVMLRHWCI